MDDIVAELLQTTRRQAEIIERQESRLAALERRVVDRAPTPATAPDRPTALTSRRGLLKLAAAGVGGVALAAGGAAGEASAQGEAIVAGNTAGTVPVATAPTELWLSDDDLSYGFGVTARGRDITVPSQGTAMIVGDAGGTTGALGVSGPGDESGTGVRGDSSYGTGVKGDSFYGSGVTAFSAYGAGFEANSIYGPAVNAHSDKGVGVVAESSLYGPAITARCETADAIHAVTYGGELAYDRPLTGVAGSAVVRPDPDLPDFEGPGERVGVRGWGSADGIGVYGQSRSAAGVKGYATSGQGVSGAATSGDAVAGVVSAANGTAGHFVAEVGTANALFVDGRVCVAKVAGIATVPRSARTVVIDPGVEVTPSSFVVATAQTDDRSAVSGVTVDSVNNRFTVTLMHRASRPTPLGWLMIN